MSFAQGEENLSAPRKPSGLEFLQHYSQQLNMAFYIHLKGSLTNSGLTLHNILFKCNCRMVFSDFLKKKNLFET